MNLRRALALAKRELYSWFNSRAFYGITVFFLLFVSVWFYYLQQFFAMDTATLRPFFSSFPLAFILVIPVITMKSWAEEKKLGTLELLLTMPFSEWDLCLGKFLSAFGLLVIMVGLTLPVPLTLLPLGFFDPGVIATEYAGVLLLGASALSLGLLLSALSQNQAGAFLGSAVVLMALVLMNQFTLSAALPSFLGETASYLSLSFHFESFSRGLLDSRDMAFFIASTGLFLFLNTQVLLFRKWR
jgi:ABC-2 type transport system permease protein